MKRLSHLHPLVKSRESGIALVVTLAIIVLVTIAVVAFFSRATSNRGIEASRANQVLAQQLSATATDYVLGQFLSEIRSSANSTSSTSSNVTIYRPSADAKIAPDTSKSPSFATSANSTFSNLIRQSTNFGDKNASDTPTTSPSSNGRIVNETRWSAPKLTGTDYNDKQVPAWIYVQSDGSTKSTPTPLGAPNPTIGRFAYNAYNIGGLLNVNIAGYPTSISASELQSIKSTQASVDLTKVGGNIPSSGTDQFVSWRNPQSLSTYSTSVLAQAARGFLSPLLGDRQITTRQDLIKLANAGQGIPASALPYLTHFSRSINAPTANSIPGSSATNPSLIDVRVPSAFPRRDGTQAKPGDPLINRRFPLRKLDLITPTATAAIGSEIEKYFGLTRANPGAPWVYRGGALSINRLDQVALEKRDPDFFEILKAGIAEGSIGKASDLKTLASVGNQALEGDEDLQIFRIGACIIDQWDSDNFPTQIATGSATQCGVEDLPYLYTAIVADRWRSQNAGGTNYNVDYALILAPMLFNPHAAPTTVTNSSQTPQNIRIRILSGFIGPINFYEYNASGSASPLDLNAPKNLQSLPSIEIPLSDFEKFRLTSQVPKSTTGRLSTQISWWNGSDEYCGFPVHQASALLSNIAVNPGNPQGWFPLISSTGLMMVVEYQGLDGQWHVYDSLAGSADLATTTGITTSAWADGWSGGVNNFTTAGVNTLTAGGQFITKWDPRSNRWSPSHGWGVGAEENPSITGPTVRRTQPFAPVTDIALGMYPEQSKNTTPPYKVVPGNDGVFRPNDGWRGSGSQRANPFRNLTVTTRRPVILQRPFQSVAELGYAFRDTPWQTLSFFDASSGDANLLDLFSLEDEPAITAGKINLNATSAKVFTALFSNTPKAADGNATSYLANPAKIADDFASFRSSLGAVVNRSQLATFLSSSSLQQENNENVKTRREAMVRAVADIADTRTWNFLVDVIAQVGRFPANGGTDPINFIVDAEQRTWTSVSVDRYYGQVISKQSESVSQ